MSAPEEPKEPGVEADDPAAASGGNGTGTDTAEERLTERQRLELRQSEQEADKQARKEEKHSRKLSKPRVRKLRFAAVFAGLGLLAIVSWVFGVLMAVAGDLPDLEAEAQFARAENSIVYATGADGEKVELATLTGNNRRILVDSEEISLLMKQAVVAIEDERFYDHEGIDYLGLARALKEDIAAGGAVQGGSTITQQFVKNALAAQEDRTILQKLKESALAYQVERQWSKDKILTNYLNNIYFGEGAYGIEAASRTFFGANHSGCGEVNPSTGKQAPSCASQLRIEEAAMLAGMISSPSAYNPKTDPQDALDRRNVVLNKMRELDFIEMDDTGFDELTSISGPAISEVAPPQEESEAPYFTEWLRQQVVDRYGAGEAFGGGLEIRSSLDLELQQQAQEIVDTRLNGLGPTSAVVVIDNTTAEIKAMVGGSDFEESPFNLATNGRRQPGSSFKPFTLVTALANGKSSSDVYESKPVEIPFTNTIRNKNGKKKEVEELFKVGNYDDNYLGSASIATATTYSDNSVYAQLGTDVGTEKIAKMARDLGVQSKVPDNPAMILGGLKRGVTPLEMAYAYSTLANDGTRVSGTMASRGNGRGPVALEKVLANDKPVEDDLGASGENEKTTDQVVDPAIAQETTDILHTVVTSGTGERAQVGDDYIWGKTGTTDNNADAWFVGSNDAVTIAVWVGYAEGGIPMETEFGGLPVDGGTIPAELFADVLGAYNAIQAERGVGEDSGDETTTTATDSSVVPVTPEPAAPVTPEPVPIAPEPEPEAPPEEAPEQPATQPPTDGGGGGGATDETGGGAVGRTEP